jgi:hypothetical protein
MWGRKSPEEERARTESTEFTEVEPGFKLRSTKMKKEAEPQALYVSTPPCSVDSVTSVRVFLLPGKQRNPPRTVGEQESGGRKGSHGVHGVHGGREGF